MLFFTREHRLKIPARWRVAIVCALALALGVHQLRQNADIASFRSDLGEAFASQTAGPTTTASWNFPFQRTRFTVSVEIADGELAAARALDTDKVFGSGGRLREGYITAFVQEQAGSAFIDRLARQFRDIRDQRGLDDDEYLEMMTAAIQSIPYGKISNRACLAPEVLSTGSGICTDKSLLLASLLLHEGYDTVLWVFTTQAHAAVGVASDHARFRDSGYAFIETTQQRFIGQVSPDYLAAGPIAKPPVQVALGGWRCYGAGDQVEVILSQLHESESAVSRQRAYAAYARTAVEHREQYAQLATQSWIAEGKAWFIMSYPYDREGVYSVLTGSASQ